MSNGSRLRVVAQLLAAILLVTLPSDLRAQTTRLIGNVLLDVKETPLRNAEILIPSLNLATRSDSLGKFALGGIPAGKHQVSVRLAGHKPVTLELLFKSTEVGDVDFIIEPTVTELANVNVKGSKTTGPWAIKLAEFDERRAAGIGKFLTADYFESQDGRPLSSFLVERIAGLKIVQTNGGRRYLASTRGGGGGGGAGQMEKLPPGCYMQVVVNGIIRWNGSGQQMFDVDELNSKDVIGFEFFTTATTPLQYNGTRGSAGGACGTVIIWTKGG